MSQVEFIAPYAQKLIGGEMGLTSIDIAKVLGVRQDHIQEKIKRLDFVKLKSYGFTFTVSTVKGSGRPLTCYTMDVKTAKFFVAKWDNDLGYAYLQYLFSLEAAMPKIKAEMEDLMKRNDDLYAQAMAYKRAAEKRKKHRNRLVNVVCNLVKISTLFGVEYETTFEQKPWDKLTDMELREARLRHNTKVSKGLAASIERDLNEDHDKLVEELKVKKKIVHTVCEEENKPKLNLIDSSAS